MKNNSKHKILSDITENTDEFSWNELNCFYRPWAIVYQGIDSEYSDL